MDLYKVRQKLSMGVPLTTLNLRVTSYSRVSTDHLEQQNSLKNQKEHFEEMIKNNSNWIYIVGYVDEGISGTTDYKRDKFMKMIDDAKNNKFDLIVTKEISRFSRNTLDSIKYTRQLLSYGVAVLFINDNINTALPDSELRLTIMASMAQDEIRRLSERVKFGMERSIKNGVILGNDMLYGYKKDKTTGNLIIIEKEALIVKRLFDLYAINNYSISKIAKTFNNEGIKTYQNKKWCVSTLTRMLKNPKYKGYYCGKKTQIIDYMTKKVKIIPEKDWLLYEDKQKIPPIVDEILWQRANERLKMRTKKIIYQNRYPLSAKIYCAEHNETFHRRCQCKSGNDITWVCAKYLKDGKQSCDSPNIRESEINTILNEIIKDLDFDFTNIKNILMEIYDNTIKNNGIDNQFMKLQKQKEKILTKKNKLLDLNIEGNLSNKEFSYRNNECNKELSIINEEISHLKRKPKDNKTQDILKKIEKNLKSKIIIDKIIELTLDKIVISKINNNKENLMLKIYLKIPGKTPLSIKKTFTFKRGYNTTCTRRYTMNYQVNIYFIEKTPKKMTNY